MITETQICDWVDRLTAAEVELLAKILRVEGARAQAETSGRSAGRDLGLLSIGPRLARRGGGVVVTDQGGLWARWAWDFTDPDWSHAELLLDDALVVVRCADLLPRDLVSAVIAPLQVVLAPLDPRSAMPN